MWEVCLIIAQELKQFNTDINCFECVNHKTLCSKIQQKLYFCNYFQWIVKFSILSLPGSLELDCTSLTSCLQWHISYHELMMSHWSSLISHTVIGPYIDYCMGSLELLFKVNEQYQVVFFPVRGCTDLLQSGSSSIINVIIEHVIHAVSIHHHLLKICYSILSSKIHFHGAKGYPIRQVCY